MVDAGLVVITVYHRFRITAVTDVIKLFLQSLIMEY
jgi:hypothetical protein